MRAARGRRPRVALAFAPGVGIELSMPPIGIAYLAASLRRRGWSCELFDLNYEFAQGARDPASRAAARAVLAQMRGDGFFDRGKREEYFLVRSRDTRFLEKGLRVLSKEDPVRCPEAEVLERLVAQTCETLAAFDVVGFSVILPSQVALTRVLVEALRSRRPDAVLLGGGPRAFDPDLEGVFDLRLAGDGERSLPQVLAQLASGRSPGAVRGRWTSEKTPDFVRDLDVLPAPEYGPLFDKYAYLSPAKVVPLAVTRGCYWSKCRFCAYGWCGGARKAPYRRHSVRRVLEQIRALSRRHGARHFFFSVDVVDPGLLGALAEGLLRARLDIRWSAEIRAERSFLAEGFAQRLHASGCRMLSMGLESASQRVLDSMDKGISFEDSRRIVERFQGAGIWMNVDTFIGYPGETPSEAARTQGYIRDRGRTAYVTPPGTYILNPDQGVFRSADRGRDVGLVYDRGTARWEKRGMSWEETRRQGRIGLAHFCCARETAFFVERLDGAFALVAADGGARVPRPGPGAGAGGRFAYGELASLFPKAFAHFLALLDAGARTVPSGAGRLRRLLSVRKTGSPRKNLEVFFRAFGRAIDRALPDAKQRRFLKRVARFEYGLLEDCLRGDGEVPTLDPGWRTRESAGLAGLLRDLRAPR